MRHQLFRMALMSSLAGTLLLGAPLQPVAAKEALAACIQPVIVEKGAKTNNQPGVLTLACPFAGNENDRIYVYDRNGDRLDSEDWRAATDFTDDLWVFDANGDRKANLIIDFHRSGSALVADIYDDQNDDANIEFHFASGRAIITESQFWTVEIVAKDGWWQRAGKVNYNLDIAVDGMVVAMPIIVPAIYQKIAVHDGKADQFVQVRDPQNRGWPDLDIRRALKADKYDVVKAAIMKDYGINHVPIQGSILFPLLGTAPGIPEVFEGTPVARLSEHNSTPASIVRTWNSFPAPFQVYWQASRVLLVGEFVASRVGNSRFIYSLNALRENEINELNFENPFDFYDLANANDGFADLQVRLETFAAYDPNFKAGKFDQPATMVRYSWDTNHDHFWDYKLGLIGRHAVDTEMRYGDYSITTLPHDRTPYWVTERNWDTAVFVQVEYPYNSSEGIYTWESLGLRNQYVTGESATPYLNDFSIIEPNMRGEYTVALQSQPQLYFSPIDKKLHLLQAEEGLWNLDNQREIRTRNLGGYYINEWKYLEQGKLVRSLYAPNGYLVYSDEHTIRLLRTDISAALFTTLPPRDHNEWRTFSQRIAAYPSVSLPEDFASIFEQFGGPITDIKGARLDSLRLQKGGFRFVLYLQPGFTVSGNTLLDLKGLYPGSYAVTYDGNFHIEPLTPPTVAVKMSIAAATQLQNSAIPVQLDNTGGTDVPAATLELWATPPQGQATLVATQTVALLAQEPTTTRLGWSPKQAGEWTLSTRVLDHDGHMLAQQTSAATVPPLAPIGTFELLSASNLGTTLPLIALIVCGFSTIAALTLRRQLPRPTNRQVDDAS